MEIETKINRLEVIEKQGDPIRIAEGLRRRRITPTEIPNNDRLKESMDFSLKHKTIKSSVLSILKSDKLARKDDFWLSLMFWIKHGHIKLVIPLEKYHEIKKPESISRCRREIFLDLKKGKYPKLKYLIEKDVEEARGKEEELYHNYYQDKNSEEVAKIVK